MKKKARLVAFTLVELAVVLFILALVSTVVMQTVTWRTPVQMAKQAGDRFLTVFKFAGEQVLLEQVALGLTVEQKGYYFSRFDPIKQSWHKIESDKILGPYFTQEGVTLTLENHLAAERLIISAEGNISGFLLTLLADGQPRYQVIGQPGGNMLLKQLEDS